MTCSVVQGYLRPSRELLEFYRRKIMQYDNERDDMIQKLERCKVAYEEKVPVVCLPWSTDDVCLVRVTLAQVGMGSAQA